MKVPTKPEISETRSMTICKEIIHLVRKAVSTEWETNICNPCNTVRSRKQITFLNVHNPAFPLVSCYHSWRVTVGKVLQLFKNWF